MANSTQTARLITDANYKQTRTTIRETDARTALTRGLAQYLRTMEYNDPYGRQLRFNQVFETWAEPEDEALYPSAAIYSAEDAMYDMSKFTPAVNHKERIALPDGRYLVTMSEMVLPITLDVWANDPTGRMDLVGLMEDVLSPVDWRYGVLLELPHYFNERGTYELMSSKYIDDEDSAKRRIRRATFVLKGRVPVVRLAAYPAIHIQKKIIVTIAAPTDP